MGLCHLLGFILRLAYWTVLRYQVLIYLVVRTKNSNSGRYFREAGIGPQRSHPHHRISSLGTDQDKQTTADNWLQRNTFIMSSAPNPNDSSSDDEGPDNIWIASSNGDILRVQQLLKEGMSINSQDEVGYSPM